MVEFLTIGGRRQFHLSKELFLSDHYDVQSANTIEGKCVVHSFKNYTKLENEGAQHYYCRLEYKAATGAFTPDRVAMYCESEMPYNPDNLMVQCEECKDWWTLLSAERNYLNCKRRYKMQCCCLCSCWCTWIAIMWYVDLE